MRHDESEGSRRDRIRWGPVWAGLVVALGTYLLLQLALIALNIVDLGAMDTADAAWSAAAALLAFFLGGVTTGATAMWRGVDDGLLHGVVMWAVGLVSLLVFSAVGGGVALGAVDTSDAFDQISGDEVEEVLEGDDPQDAAGRALLALSAALLAAAIGGVVGAKLWPDEYEEERVRMSRSAGGTGSPSGGYRDDATTRQEARR